MKTKIRLWLLLLITLTGTSLASGSESGLELAQIGFNQSSFDAECRFSCPSSAPIFSNNAFERPAVFCWFEQPDSGQERNKDTRPLKRNMLRQKESDPNTISEAVIQKEMQFSTEDKIRACIGGGCLGSVIGAVLGLYVNAAITQPSDNEGLAVLPGFIIGGCAGIILGAKAMYEIEEHSERKVAKNRLLARRKNETQSAVTEVK